MNHVGTIRLETERLLLRRFTLNDILPYYNNLGSKPECFKYMPHPHHKDILGSINSVCKAIESYHFKNYYRWCIELKETGELIGYICAAKANDDYPEHVLGYAINNKHWSNGYVTEATKAVLKLMFETVGLNRVSAMCNSNNIAYYTVMEKCGMSREGILRERAVDNSGSGDLYEYAILRREYFDEDSNNLQENKNNQ